MGNVEQFSVSWAGESENVAKSPSKEICIFLLKAKESMMSSQGQLFFFFFNSGSCVEDALERTVIGSRGKSKGNIRTFTFTERLL